jgi:hypothetical protein
MILTAASTKTIRLPSRLWSKSVAAGWQRQKIALILLAIALVLAGGCRPVMEVSGTVTVDGKPEGGIVVMFDPVEPDLARGVATTDSHGAYLLRRLGPGNKTGIVTGKYAVKLMADIDDPSAAKIPPKYFRGTELEYEVVSGKDNVYDIEVTTK